MVPGMSVGRAGKMDAAAFDAYMSAVDAEAEATKLAGGATTAKSAKQKQQPPPSARVDDHGAPTATAPTVTATDKKKTKKAEKAAAEDARTKEGVRAALAAPRPDSVPTLTAKQLEALDEDEFAAYMAAVDAEAQRKTLEAQLRKQQ